jgi:hypothetical protein
MGQKKKGAEKSLTSQLGGSNDNYILILTGALFYLLMELIIPIHKKNYPLSEVAGFFLSIGISENCRF